MTIDMLCDCGKSPRRTPFLLSAMSVDHKWILPCNNRAKKAREAPTAVVRVARALKKKNEEVRKRASQAPPATLQRKGKKK